MCKKKLRLLCCELCLRPVLMLRGLFNVFVTLRGQMSLIYVCTHLGYKQVTFTILKDRNKLSIQRHCYITLEWSSQFPVLRRISRNDLNQIEFNSTKTKRRCLKKFLMLIRLITKLISYFMNEVCISPLMREWERSFFLVNILGIASTKEGSTLVIFSGWWMKAILRKVEFAIKRIIISQSDGHTKQRR